MEVVWCAPSSLLPSSSLSSSSLTSCSSIAITFLFPLARGSCPPLTPLMLVLSTPVYAVFSEMTSLEQKTRRQTPIWGSKCGAKRPLRSRKHRVRHRFWGSKCSAKRPLRSRKHRVRHRFEGSKYAAKRSLLSGKHHVRYRFWGSNVFQNDPL